MWNNTTNQPARTRIIEELEHLQRAEGTRKEIKRLQIIGVTKERATTAENITIIRIGVGNPYTITFGRIPKQL